jgi:hypothetical protein
MHFVLGAGKEGKFNQLIVGTKIKIMPFYLRGFLYPEDGVSRFLRYVGNFLPNYTASHPIRP